jgi:hypothetical protein
MKQYFYIKNGNKFGLVDIEELKSLSKQQERVKKYCA